MTNWVFVHVLDVIFVV